ncbi:MAG: AAA family ATPase [Chloroflexi bacterium]|nr:AAA family ATPase [Chloroflexota bacterium]
MTDLLATLASYVPALVARRLSQHPVAADQPVAENIPAAALLADISGFTALAERLAQAGPAGAEELTRLLNGYFGQLIDLIAAHGGDVVKFAGDALLALWPADSGGGPPALRTAALRAEQCGLQIQKTLQEYTAAGGLRLSMRLSVAAGEVFTAQLGGVNQRWELLVAGEPIVQVSAANKQAQPGQVVVAPGAWALTQSACRGVALPPQPQGSPEVLEAVLFPVPLRPAAAPPLSPEAEAALRTYIPPAVLSRLAAGQTAWLAELRRITVVFINLPDLNSRTAPAQAQEIVQALQSDAHRYEGSINKLNVDDKGASLVVATGLPPLAHEDDAARGVQAALAMRDSLRKLGARCHIGIATGRAFCGSVGNDTRREYTMVGGVVNLAARLMQAATDDVLCDAATHQAASAGLDFTSLPAITVKGRTEPVPVYRPLPGGKQAARRPQPATSSGIVGRVAERALLAELIPALTLHRQSSLVIIEGEAGIGKSRLIGDLRRQAEARHARVLMASGSAIERATVYHAWRPVFNELFGLDPLAEPDARRESVLRQLGDRPQLLRLAPLLSGLLSLDMPDNDLTAEMAGQSRADNIRLALLQLLQAAAAKPLTLIVEDAHWLDSASWALTALAAERVRPLLLVVATRPLGDPANPSAETAALPSAYMELIRTPGAHRLQLAALSPEETVSLVRSRLGVTSLPEAVSAFIRDKAEGHPFFSEELVVRQAYCDGRQLHCRPRRSTTAADQTPINLGLATY